MSYVHRDMNKQRLLRGLIWLKKTKTKRFWSPFYNASNGKSQKGLWLVKLLDNDCVKFIPTAQPGL